jgi:hypothetical protein
MIYTTVSVGYERKINLGDYEHCTVSASLWARVDEEEDINGVMALMFQDCKKAAMAQVVYPDRSPVNTNIRR